MRSAVAPVGVAPIGDGRRVVTFVEGSVPGRESPLRSLAIGIGRRRGTGRKQLGVPGRFTIRRRRLAFRGRLTIPRPRTRRGEQNDATHEPTSVATPHSHPPKAFLRSYGYGPPRSSL